MRGTCEDPYSIRLLAHIICLHEQVDMFVQRGGSPTDGCLGTCDRLMAAFTKAAASKTTRLDKDVRNAQAASSTHARSTGTLGSS